MSFDKKTLNNFRNDLKEALAPLEDKYGIVTTQGNITYSEFQFGVKLTCTMEKEQFEKDCRLYGFEPTDYMREFTHDGKVFRLVGFKYKSPKNNCKIQNVKTGAIFSCPDSMVKRCF